MHHRGIDRWQHSHVFSHDKKHIERKTLIVVIITISMMVIGWGMDIKSTGQQS